MAWLLFTVPAPCTSGNLFLQSSRHMFQSGVAWHVAPVSLTGAENRLPVLILP